MAEHVAVAQRSTGVPEGLEAPVLQRDLWTIPGQSLAQTEVPDLCGVALKGRGNAVHEAMKRLDGFGRSDVIKQAQDDRGQDVANRARRARAVFCDAQRRVRGSSLSVHAAHDKGRAVGAATDLHFVPMAKPATDQHALAFDVHPFSGLPHDVVKEDDRASKRWVNVVGRAPVPRHNQGMEACSLLRPRRLKHPAEQPCPQPRVSRDLDGHDLASSPEASHAKRQAPLAAAQGLWKRSVDDLLGRVPCRDPRLVPARSDLMRPITDHLVQRLALWPTGSPSLPVERRGLFQIPDPHVRDRIKRLVQATQDAQPAHKRSSRMTVRDFVMAAKSERTPWDSEHRSRHSGGRQGQP